MNPEDIQNRINEIETQMAGGEFWNDKNKAQGLIKELGELKNKLDGVGVYDRGGAVLNILSGAGGDDAEDFSGMLLHMYQKYCDSKNLSYKFTDANENTNGGYRHVTMEITGSVKSGEGKIGPYGLLKHESGVHRLVRQSPFNADAKRQTSFSLVEIIPIIEKTSAIQIAPADLKIELSKSGGPGGQNVNKRETAVRIVHIPTGIAVSASTERSQEQNKEQAMKLLLGKLIKKSEDEHKTLEESMQISKTTDIEWGSQMRSYVLHPYKMVKDHRTGYETSDVSAVLEDGDIDGFIEAEKVL